MTVLPLLLEWAVRSSLLILIGALLLLVLRVKDSSHRLAGWTAVLVSSLAIPVLAATVPNVPVRSAWLPTARLAMPRATAPVEVPAAVPDTAFDATPLRTAAARRDDLAPRAASGLAGGRHRFDSTPGWALIILSVYGSIAVSLLVRTVAGLAMSLRLLRGGHATGQATDGIPIHRSDRVAGPVTLGLQRPVIVLPADWAEWDPATLHAVLAHERSHARRRDPAVQLLSMLHRAILWFSPLAWFLHQRIVRAAEEASDDAALAAIGDRARYAEVLLGFMRSSGRLKAAPTLGVNAVPMARYGSPRRRIERILDGTGVSGGVTRWHAAAIVVVALPLAYVVAAAQARPEFEIADVHVSSPRRDGQKVGQMDGVTGNFVSPVVGAVRGGRYELHHATLMELIRTAYAVEADAVVGGPGWLTSDSDRFDVIAKPPPGRPTAAALNEMLQSLLADRFKLVVRHETRPLRAWVLSKEPGEPKLRNADPAGVPACRIVDDNQRVSCRNVTMDAFAVAIRAGTLTTLPVVNATGIQGSWDFDLRYTVARGYFGVASGNPLLDAVGKQLGLQLKLASVSQPVLVVERVERRPTANVAGVETRLPADPTAFDVASIRPCDAARPVTRGFQPAASWLRDVCHYECSSRWRGAVHGASRARRVGWARSASPSWPDPRFRFWTAATSSSRPCCATC